MSKHKEASEYFYKQMELGLIKNDEQQEVYEMAIEAIEKANKYDEKETPMKVTNIHVDEYCCPKCGSELNCSDAIVEDNYCSVCGQRITTEEGTDE